MKKLLMASSNTSSNIGNDFFYRGVRWAVKNTVKADFYDGYFFPFNAYGMNEAQRKNNYDYFSCFSGVDAIVIAGPVLDANFGMHFECALRNAKSSGKKIFLLSAGGREYTREEIEHCSSVLKKYPPDIFISRDNETFENYSAFSERSYNGICFAFFAPEYFSGYETSEIGDYLTSVFDFTSEPNIDDFVDALNGNATLKIESHGTKSKVDRFKYFIQRSQPDYSKGYKIIRTCHRPHRKGSYIFFKKNMLSSFVSDPYLNLYKNTSLTITDRLHAAVVTLSFGKPACLVLKSNRVKLLERAGIAGCVNSIYHADLELLKKERVKQYAFMEKAFSDMGWCTNE